MTAPELSLTIKWSADADVEPMTYTFATIEEQVGFMQGVDEACGWLEYDLLAVDGKREVSAS